MQNRQIFFRHQVWSIRSIMQKHNSRPGHTPFPWPHSRWGSGSANCGWGHTTIHIGDKTIIGLHIPIRSPPTRTNSEMLDRSLE